MPCLDHTKHTIFGRMLKGKDTLRIIEGLADYKRQKISTQLKLKSGIEIENNKKPVLTESTQHTNVVIKDCGVYKFSRSNSAGRRTPVVRDKDFRPEDFLNARANR